MFDHPILDVVIGLVFIFLLYSLLASAINEFMATIFAHRARMLERGLEQMLDGKNISYYWWDKICNFFLWLYFLVRHSLAKNPQEHVARRTFYLTHRINDDDNAKNYISRRKLNSKARLFAARVVNHPIYRRKSEDSLLSKKPAYLQAGSFSDILVDLLNNQNANAGVPIEIKRIQAFVDNQLRQNPGLQRILQLYLDQANGDLQRFKILLEQWYDDTMVRVSGWYKRQSYKILLITGLFLAVSFKVSTIHLIQLLSKDKKARAALVQNATSYIDNHYREQGTSANPTAENATGHNTGSKNPADTSLVKVKQELAEIKKIYTDDIEDNNVLLGMGWGDYGYTDDSAHFAQTLMAYKRRRDSIWQLPQPIRDTIKRFIRPSGPPHPAGFFQKLWYVLGQTFTNPKLLLGFLLTALAISMGAPFWFDLLNKFVNLKGSGRKPEESAASVSRKTTSLNQKPNPRAFG